MEASLAHQLILPTDKRNPCFSLYLSEDQESIEVFYGLELLEVVPDDPEHPAFKMMVGRLANAKVRLATLEDVFNVDRKTIRSWGKAILSRDIESLARVLLGRGVNQKRTPAIDKYVVRRWAELRAEGRPDFRAALAGEIENIFEVKLSGETLRQIVNEFKGDDIVTPDSPDAGETGPPDYPSPAPSAPVLGESTCSVETVTTSDDLVSNLLEPCFQATSSAISPATDAPEASKCSPPNWQPQPGDTILCDHVGMLIFASSLATIANATTPPEPLLAQWLASIMLGAVNIEQTKYLNWEDLGNLLGQTVRFPTPQREQLTRLATPATIDAVLRWNYQQLATNPGDNDFYYDPHTAHYTGMQQVLKGWCAAIRWADKLINSDYIHTSKGHPIYFECTDNYDDLRARFAPLIGRLRTCLQWTPERVLTFVVDRGIYSNQIFNQVLADPSIHLITWEKGYQAAADTPWETLSNEHQAAGTHGSHTFKRQRNNAKDHRSYHFEYIHRPWAKNPAIRQIIVRATNPKGNTVQLSVLTDDNQRPTHETVRLIFNRWIQENDFKYLDKHFGINQLTSYRSTPYEQLRDQLTDRQVPNHAYVQKVKTGRQLDQRKARLLLADDQAQRDQTRRQLDLDQIHSGIAKRATDYPENLAVSIPSAAESKEIARHLNATKRHHKYRQARVLKIENIHQQILQNDREKVALDKEVSRIDQLIAQDMVRMNLANKTLMDAIKISARNLFYRLFAPFKTAYDNYRDDHCHYRELTQCDGLLRWTGSEIEVHLVPQVNYPPKLRKIIERHLADLNASGLTLPDGSGRPLRLRLTRKEQISVRIDDSTDV
jgi:hypothetical protein